MSELFPNVNTTLDLNGPTLVFTENPVGLTTNHRGSVTLSGFATAIFPEGQTERSSNTGSIVYQWYNNNGPLIDSINVIGSATTSLTVTNLLNPINAQDQFFLRADYIPSAYANGTTGNAVVDPKDSDTAIVITAPEISVSVATTPVTTAENQNATFNVSASITDNSALSYQWRIDGQIINERAYASGDQSTTYTVTTGDIDGQNLGIGTYLVNCTVSNPNAIPSQVVSDDILLNVVSARSILAYELVDSSWNGGGVKDLVNQGFLEFDANDSDERSIVIYPTEKDVDVLITLGGSKGDTKNGNRGGEGGLSSFRLTLNQNEEYFIRLGVPYSVGGSNDFGGVVGGGGASIFHRRANRVAVCGGGGGGGQNNRGGDGGGVNLAGEDGVGRNGGNGGVRFDIGELDDVGSYAKTVNFNNTTSYSNNANNVVGGKLSTCTVGDYWANQGYSQCQNLGNIKYRNSSGTEITQTAQIDRGYKAGGNFRRNGGNGSGNQGGGGAGVEGGSAALSDGSGGGGGSGYSNGEITIISSTVGGNNDYGYIKIEDYGSTLT